MSGRPTFVGIIALAIAMLAVGDFAAPRIAMAEFRVPLPGSDKKAVKRKRVRNVRPTRPSRNPTRVSAGVSAAAISPKVADNSEATVVAGTSSSASVAIALPAHLRVERNETEPPAVASLPSPDADDTEDEVASGDSREDGKAKDETAKDETAKDETAEDEAAKDETASNEDAQDEDSVSAQTDTPQSDPSEEDPTETAETVVEDDKDRAEASSDADDETASLAEAGSEDRDVASSEGEGPDGQKEDVGDTETAAASRATDEDTEPARRNELTALNEPAETAALEAGATETAEPEQSSEAEGKAEDKAEDAEVIVEIADRPETVPPEAARSLDGSSVVLQVSPPPEIVLNATEPNDESAESVPVAADPKTDEEPGEVVETKVASLTPPDAPAAADSADAPAEVAATVPETDTVDAPAGDAKEPDAISVESASSAEDEADTDGQATDTAASETDATDTSEDKDTTEAARESNEGERANENAVGAVSEPPPPPAHPVIARVREKLDEPDSFKRVAASDLTALKAYYGAHTEPPLWISDSGFSTKAKAIVAAIGEADNWGLEASSFALPAADAVPASEEAQADAEIAMSAAILSYARDAQIGRLTPSRVSKLFDQHPKLRDPKTVLTEIGAAGAPEKALVSLHPQHTGFKRLQQALMRARDSAKITGRDPDRDRNVQRIVMNMERWRWLPRQLGNYYVWNNVPEFQVEVLKGGRTIYQEKTIVGQYKYATPFFSAPMRNIVFNPNWTVPPTIVREDIAPKLKGPSGGGFFGRSKKNTLRRFGLAVSFKGEPIDADTVDWDNVNIHKYTFTQDAGPANVLGQFKFNFPNKHAIYMHDTVQRDLFSTRQRTLSHGCIRVHQPDRLATLLLSEDKGWSLNQVRSLVAQKQTKVISFNRRVPVHLTYFTVTVDENGAVRDFNDIYGIDSRMAPKLFANPEYFPMPAVTPVAETSQNTRPSRPQRRQSSNRGFDGFISGLFSN